jgi:hypothetical protein
MNAHIRLRTVPMIALAGVMIVAALLTAAPAAAAKGHASISFFCFSTGQNTPGYPIGCQAAVNGLPAPTGALTISASSSKGTVNGGCTFLSNCSFSYTPKGKGSAHRKDTITVRYSGDDHYYSARASTKIAVLASPPMGLQLSCPASTTTGSFAYCSLSIQPHGFPGGNSVDVKVPSYKGAVTPAQCPAFQGSCTVIFIPKGRGYDTRVDTITASYAGDLYNSPNKVTAKVHVGAAP